MAYFIPPASSLVIGTSESNEGFHLLQANKEVENLFNSLGGLEEELTSVPPLKIVEESSKPTCKELFDKFAHNLVQFYAYYKHGRCPKTLPPSFDTVVNLFFKMGPTKNKPPRAMLIEEIKMKFKAHLSDRSKSIESKMLKLQHKDAKRQACKAQSGIDERNDWFEKNTQQGDIVNMPIQGYDALKGQNVTNIHAYLVTGIDVERHTIDLNLLDTLLSDELVPKHFLFKPWSTLVRSRAVTGSFTVCCTPVFQFNFNWIFIFDFKCSNESYPGPEQ